MRHAGLVHKICQRYRWVESPSYSLDDLKQDAMLAAWQATRDESKLTCAPSTAVLYAVRSSAQRGIARMARPVRMPRLKGVWNCHRVDPLAAPGAGFRGGSDRAKQDQYPAAVFGFTEAPAMFGGRLSAGFAALGERDRKVLSMRCHGYTLEEVGEELGITRERVRQLETRAIARLREKVANERPAQR